MNNLWLHRYSLLLAVCTFFLVIAGGLVVSHEAGLAVPDWPLSYGQVMPEMEGGVFYEHSHRIIASLVGFLTIILAVWLWRAEDRPWLKKLGFLALLLVIVQGLLGGLTVLYLLPKPISILHACLAQIFFATTVAIALFTSPGGRRPARPSWDDTGSELHWLALAAPLAVVAQLALGAAYRHKALGIVPHVLGAAAVTTILIWLALRILVSHSDTPLRLPALWLIGITLVQVFLGIGAYMSRIATIGSPQPMPVMVLLTVAHVAVGALTLAASTVCAIESWRYVKSAPVVTAGEGVPAIP